MAPVFSKFGAQPTATNATHLSSFFKVKALPGMERALKEAKNALMAHLANKPEIWKFMNGTANGIQKYSKVITEWDLARTTLQRAVIDLSDRSIMVELESIGPWHLAEYRKGGDWEERIIAHALQTSRSQIGIAPTKPLPPPAAVKVVFQSFDEPASVISDVQDEEFGILDEEYNEFPVEEPWDSETETPTPFPEEETPMAKFTPAKQSDKPAAPAAKPVAKKAAPVAKKPTKTAAKVIAAAKSPKAAKPVAKKAAPVLKAKGPLNDTRAEVIKGLLKRKFIKDAIAQGHLTEANLRKTPTPRLEKMLERGSYKG
jgi:hypothetical protein